MPRFLLAALLVFVGGCNAKLSQPPEIMSTGEQGSTELVFMLSDHRVGEDGSQSLSAVGLLQRRTVGFDIRFGPWLESGPGLINMSTWESKTAISSRGAASDELLKFLAKLYSTQLSPRAMASPVECNALSPWENPGAFRDEPVKLLLLFHGGFDETRDAEVWLEIRPRESKVYLREKEPRFRRSLILTLAEQMD